MTENAKTQKPLSDKRRAAIMESLQAGNQIRRSWNGSNLSGYLSHEIQGVSRLREAEVDVLRNEGLLVSVYRGAGTFDSLRLRTPADDEADAKRKAEREAQEAARQQEQEEKNTRANRLADALDRLEFSNFENVIADGAVVTFEYGERRYRIEEIAD